MNPDDYIDKLLGVWRRIPGQIKRLPILLVLLVIALLVIRSMLVPSDFGKYGHYRGSALADAASQEIQYAGQYVCADCHEDEFDAKNEGYHKSLSCEICHGPAAKHTDDPDEGQLRAPRDRGYCPLCHEYLPSRPTGFPQIITASHNPRKPCISCHEPHNPARPDPPEGCEACHTTIARTKALSEHVYVPCTRCHDAPKEHNVNPRRYIPSRPSNREFCGECHDAQGPGDRDVKKIDMTRHGEHYVCWQCHYPHLPEVH